MVYCELIVVTLVIDFYNDVNLIFSVVQDECTTYTCPIMSAGLGWGELKRTDL